MEFDRGPHVVEKSHATSDEGDGVSGRSEESAQRRAVSEATISPQKSVPIHSVHPMTPYYLRVALDDGFNDMEPAQRLLPVSPMAIDALKSAGTLDAFELFDTPFAVADQSDDASTSMDEIKLRNKDGRTAVLEARTDFGFVSNAPRTTVISANVIVVNKTDVDLVMRTSTAQLSTSDDGDSSMSKVKFLDTRATHSNRGVELLRKFVLRKAPKDGEVLCLEVGVGESERRVQAASFARNSDVRARTSERRRRRARRLSRRIVIFGHRANGNGRRVREIWFASRVHRKPRCRDESNRRGHRHGANIA